MMTSCFVIVAILAVIASLYLLLPVLACRFSRLLAQAVLDRQHFLPARSKKRNHLTGWLSMVIDNSRARLSQAGFTNPSALKLYFASQYGIPVLTFLVGLISGKQVLQPFAGSVLLAVLVNHLLKHRADERRKSFVRSLYKIYRFLDSQITSGIAVTDALRGLTQAVRDPVIDPALMQFTAVYEVTLDSEKAFDVLRRLFKSRECDLLAAHVHQCLQSGVAGKSIARMEELLFTRTYSLMQEETRRIRLRLTMIAAGGLVPLLVLFLYPMLHGAWTALQSIFS